MNYRTLIEKGIRVQKKATLNHEWLFSKISFYDLQIITPLFVRYDIQAFGFFIF